MAELARRIVTAGGQQRALLRERYNDPCPRPANRKPALERRDEDRRKPLAKPDRLQRDTLRHGRRKPSHRLRAEACRHADSDSAADEHTNRSPELDTDQHADSSADDGTDEHPDSSANDGTHEHPDRDTDADAEARPEAEAHADAVMK